MKLWDNLVKKINPDEEEPFGDDFSDDELYGPADGNSGNAGDFMVSGGYSSPYVNQNQNQGGYGAQQQGGYQSQPMTDNNGVIVSSGNNMPPISVTSEIKLFKGENFKQFTQIADLVKSGRVVLLDLVDTDKETARRLIDALMGVTYAINGDMQRASERTFVIAPNNMTISQAQIKEEQRKNVNANINNNTNDNSIY